MASTPPTTCVIGEVPRLLDRSSSRRSPKRYTAPAPTTQGFGAGDGLNDGVLSDLTTSPQGIDLRVDGTRLRLSWTWLRDHARDSGSYLESAHQRLVSPDTVATAGPGSAALDGDRLIVSWDDGPTAPFDARFLRSLGDQRQATATGPSAKAWTGSDMTARLGRFDGADIVASDDVLRDALNHVWRDGLIVIESVPTTSTATRDVLERFGYLRSTIFGDLWEFGSDGELDDTASTSLAITPHTDGTYSHDAPGLLGLHCHVSAASGGHNVFVDANKLADGLSDSAHDLLRTVEIPGQYIGDGAHLMARRPTLRYESDRLVQVSYNHHDRAPFVLPEPAMSRLYAALREFDSLANEHQLQFELALRPGDMALFDNWRLLHGRRAFQGERRIAGGYINREDVESTTRRLVASGG